MVNLHERLPALDTRSRLRQHDEPHGRIDLIA